MKNLKINPKIEMSNWYLEQTKPKQVKPRISYNKDYLDNTGFINWHVNSIPQNIEYSINYEKFIKASPTRLPFINYNPQIPKYMTNPNIPYNIYGF